jgi:hypothetical protein
MEIKGTAVKAIRDFVKTYYQDKFEDWLELLPAGAKQIYTGTIDSTKWYPLSEGGIVPTLKIGELFFSGNYNVAALESGKYSAQKALTGIYNFFVKASSPAHILNSTPKIFSSYYRPGQLTIKNKKDNEVTLQISNMTQNNDVIEHRIAGWLYKAMEISGAKSVRIEFTKSMAKGDAITQLDIQWT